MHRKQLTYGSGNGHQKFRAKGREGWRLGQWGSHHESDESESVIFRKLPSVLLIPVRGLVLFFGGSCRFEALERSCVTKGSETELEV